MKTALPVIPASTEPLPGSRSYNTTDLTFPRGTFEPSTEPLPNDPKPITPFIGFEERFVCE